MSLRGSILLVCAGAVLGIAALVAVAGSLRPGSNSGSRMVEFGAAGTAIARCGTGTTALSGGFQGEYDASKVVSGDSPQLLVYESRRRSERSWAGSAYNVGEAGRLTTFVECRAGQARADSKATTIEGTPIMTDARKGGVTARCPAGKSVVSGGFDNPDFSLTGDYGSDARLVPYISRRAGPRSWRVDAANNGGADGTLVAYAYCQDAPVPRAKRKTVSFAAPVDGVRLKGVVARCPRGGRVVSGGFKLVGSAPELVASRKVDRRRWRASAAVGYPGEATLTAYAYCVR